MINCNIRSLYLCVLDMERAIAFYEDFFERPVTTRDSIYSVFEINGFRLGLFAFEKNRNLTALEITACRVLKLRTQKHYTGNYAG